MNKILLKVFLIFFTISTPIYLLIFKFVFHEMSREIITTGLFVGFFGGLSQVLFTKKRIKNAANKAD